MGFNIMGGLSAMGGAIAQTAGAAALEIQRSELEKDKIALAEQLAARRESEGRQEQAGINEKAADKEMGFRAGESMLNRAHETDLTNIRESGEDRRLITREKGETTRAGMAEGNSQRRFDAEMNFRIDQAKEATKSREEDRALSTAIAAATKTVMEEYTTTGGDKASRPVKVFDPEQAAEILRPNYPKLAATLAPKAKATPVTGKRPPLDSFFKDAEKNE